MATSFFLDGSGCCEDAAACCDSVLIVHTLLRCLVGWAVLDGAFHVGLHHLLFYLLVTPCTYYALRLFVVPIFLFFLCFCFLVLLSYGRHVGC